jgi:type IV pilus assembly protein PilW
MFSQFTRKRQRGLSLVEMMVGIAVGLFIAAGASLLVAIQLSDNRRTLIELQLQQDLRASSDIIGRELRRSGFMAPAHLLIAQGGSQPYSFSGNSARQVYTTGDSSTITFYYTRRNDTQGPFGFRLNSSGAIQSLLAGGQWQDLTDSSVMTVTSFSLTPRTGPAQKLACPKYCDLTIPGLPAGTGADYCWPTVSVLSFDISITGKSVSDASVVRTVTTTAYVRNDYVKINMTAADGSIDYGRYCPS